LFTPLGIRPADEAFDVCAFARGGLFLSVYDRGVGWFWIVVRIEEQWMLPEPPRPAIVEAPKGDTFDHILVLLEDREEPRVVFGLRFEVLGGRRRGVTDASSAKASAKTLTGVAASVPSFIRKLK
jgi:hypothetical protein